MSAPKQATPAGNKTAPSKFNPHAKRGATDEPLGKLAGATPPKPTTPPALPAK